MKKIAAFLFISITVIIGIPYAIILMMKAGGELITEDYISNFMNWLNKKS